MESNNRRKFQRIEFDGMACLKIGEHVYDCCPIKDLSLTGMFIAGNFQKHKVKKCTVKIFHKENDELNSLLATGKVVRVNEEGIGLRFTEMSFENYVLLQTTLSNKAEEPTIILREFPEKIPFKIKDI